ncbi:hypothetical protein BOX15_Mlig032475g1 [Macrostomum lignano]|uniref:Bestrophin homolog n=1 Tax=Macrostomum lignano TaxID=282301 RepID=A0A267GGK3_9PLAT|nr:hypothetical protein BOX15_Mlig032475g1 [Macrostomum lignano]
MAVSYAAKIYTKDRLFFIKLLFRWAGSVWQLLWVDFLVFVALYVSLAVLYQLILYNDAKMKATFEVTVSWLKTVSTSVPLSFMLGFFVSSVVQRWWSVCMSIPWVQTPSFYCQALLDSPKASRSDLARKLRITVLRYLNLAWILMMARVSLHIRERFGYFEPKSKTKKFKHTWKRRLKMVNSDIKVQKYFGQLVTDNEVLAFGRSAQLSSENKHSYDPEYWLPLVWATRLIRRARNLDCIANERHCLWLMDIVQKFRFDLQKIWMYSEFNIPLVYTQVAVTAVYLYLACTIVSTQLMDSDIVQSSTATFNVNGTYSRTTGQQVLAFIPLLGGLEFIFYLGWFKIGMCLLNPMGKDEADIPMSDILNSNLKGAIKMGGAEDSIFPRGLTDSGEAEEAQVADFLGCFDFSQVHAHDKFGSAEQTERQLNKAMLKRMRDRGKQLASTHGGGHGSHGSHRDGTHSAGSLAVPKSAQSSERSSIRKKKGRKFNDDNQLTVGSNGDTVHSATSLGGISGWKLRAAVAKSQKLRSGKAESSLNEEPTQITFVRAAGNVPAVAVVDADSGTDVK